MTYDWGDAKELVALITFLGAVGPLLWMFQNLGTADADQFMRVGVSVVTDAAMPAIGLTIFIFALLKGASFLAEIDA